MPSLYEGFGYAAAQALCAGAPCIVSDQGALPEIAGSDAPRRPARRRVGLDESASAPLSRERDDARAARDARRSIARFAWPASARRDERVYRAALPSRSVSPAHPETRSRHPAQRSA